MNALPGLGVLLAAIVGGLATPRGLQSWYGTLAKPSWNPPNWLFGPVWTILYILMATAGTRVASSDHPQKNLALGVFAAQLILNALWSWLFFGWRRIDLAFLEILLLVALIAANLILFLRIDRTAGLLLIPYLLWVAFASILNGTVWRLNP